MYKRCSHGLLLEGSEDVLDRSAAEFAAMPVDLDLSGEPPERPRRIENTIAEPVELSGPGTFFRKEIRHIRMEPSEVSGWWLDRRDRPQSLPIKVSVRNVWTTGDIVSNIVLRSGSADNYMRLVEHLIALRVGSDIDNLMIHINSGDPPLFDRGSLDLIEALEKAGRRPSGRPLRYLTVKEPVAYARSNGAFTIIRPYNPEKPALNIDCGIRFNNAIGCQRLKFPLSQAAFRTGAEARTNTNTKAILFCKTIGLMLADIRNLGYTRHNVLIAGHHGYLNQPRLTHNGKSLEAVWHRAVLDLLASFALIEEGRLLGEVVSYKAGHYQDVELVKLLYVNDLLCEAPLPPSA